MRRAVVTSAIGVGAGQLILFASTPLLTRAYTPQEFGVYAVSFAIAGVLATVAALRYDLAISSSEESDVSALFAFALCLPLAIVPMITMALFAVQQLIAFELPLDTPAVIIATAATAMFQAMVLVSWSYFARLGRFQTSSMLRIAQPTVFVAAALFLFDSLIFAMLVSWAATILLIICVLVKERSLSLRDGILKTATKYRKMSAVSTPMTLLDSLTLAVPVIFIGFAFGDDSAGQYSQVQRLVAAPLMLLSMSISPVFMKYGGDAFREKSPILDVVLRIFKVILSISVLYAIVITITGETIIAIIMGDLWKTDLTFLLLCLIPVAFRACVSPLSGIFALVDRISVGSIWQALYFCTTVLIIFISYEYLDWVGFLILLMAHELVLYLFYLAFILIVARGADKARTMEASERALLAKAPSFFRK